MPALTDRSRYATGGVHGGHTTGPDHSAALAQVAEQMSTNRALNETLMNYLQTAIDEVCETDSTLYQPYYTLKKAAVEQYKRSCTVS